MKSADPTADLTAALAAGDADAAALALRDGAGESVDVDEARRLLDAARGANHDEVVLLLEAHFVLR